MIMILSHIVESRNGESGLHVLHIKKLTKSLYFVKIYTDSKIYTSKLLKK